MQLHIGYRIWWYLNFFLSSRNKATKVPNLRLDSIHPALAGLFLPFTGLSPLSPPTGDHCCWLRRQAVEEQVEPLTLYVWF